jgi:hypothetical protein
MSFVRTPSVFFLLLVGCSVTAPATSSSEGPAGSDASTDGESPAGECTPGTSDELMPVVTRMNEHVALALGDDVLGLSYFDANSKVNLGLIASDGGSKNLVLTGAINNAVYKSYGTGLAYGHGAFGVGFDMERLPDIETAERGLSGVGFVVLDIATERASHPSMANLDLDRTGGGGGAPVQAGGPRVTPTSNGFFTSWYDTRTAEPSRYNVNISGWGGLYGRVYDATGKAKSSNDVQVQQQGLPYGFSIVPTGSGLLAVWANTNDAHNGSLVFAKEGPASGNFTVPAASAPRTADIFGVPNSRPQRLATAAGADGNVLAVVAVKTFSEQTTLHALLLSERGKLLSSKVLSSLKDERSGRIAVSLAPNGYTAAFMSEGESQSTENLHVVDVDASGTPGEDVVTELTQGAMEEDVAIRATAAKTQVYFMTGASPSLSVRSYTVCRAR